MTHKYDPRKRKATMKKRSVDLLNTASITEVVTELRIDDDDWDALIFGDGSGTDWKNSIGYAACIVDHYGNFRAPIWGACNTGTSQLAEVKPYIDAMLWYDANVGPQRIKNRLASGRMPVRIHCITDNQNLCNQGNGTAQRKAYKALWHVFDGYITDGYKFTWHWVARLRLGLNKYADTVAGLCREWINDVELTDGTLVRDINLYSYNAGNSDTQMEDNEGSETITESD